jgi:hypothetical protein
MQPDSSEGGPFAISANSELSSITFSIDPSVGSTLTPTLLWKNTKSKRFYFEMQNIASTETFEITLGSF